MEEEKVSDLESLVDYLKIPEQKNLNESNIHFTIIKPQFSQELEVMVYKEFMKKYRKINLPQHLYYSHYGMFSKVILQSGTIKYKRYNHNFQHELWPEEEVEDDIVEFTIPDELYNSHSFFINSYNEIVSTTLPEAVLNFTLHYIDYKPIHFNDLNQNEDYILDYTDHEGDDWSFWSILTKIYIEDYNYSKKQRKIIVFYDLNIEQSAYRFPLIIKSIKSKFKYRLCYYFDDVNKNPANYTQNDKGKFAVDIHFTSLMTLLVFLNQTIFSQGKVDFDDNDNQKMFYSSLVNQIEEFIETADFEDMMVLFYYLPPFLFKFLKLKDIWGVLFKALDSSLTNYRRDDETIALKVLRVIYAYYVKKGNASNKTPNDLFLEGLITHKVDKETVLQQLIFHLDGEHFQQFILFVWQIWKNSSYASPYQKGNTKITFNENNSPLLNYQSDKKYGFYTDNATIDWNNKSKKIDISITQKTGRKTSKIVPLGNSVQSIIVDEYEKLDYEYHPFSPLMITSESNSGFIFEDNSASSNNFIHIPAFILLSNDQSTTIQNYLQTGQYILDIVTTFSGVGNILKAGRLFRLLKGGKTLVFRSKLATKTIAHVKQTAGVIEISSGAANALLKLMETEDTPFGRAISKYLFWLEMLSLSGELTVALRSALKKNARKVLAHADELAKLEKQANDVLAKNLDQKSVLAKEAEETLEMLRHLEEVGTQASKRHFKSISGSISLLLSLKEGLLISLEHEDSKEMR
ncbi:MAG: hypothetical protein ACPGVE_02830, partial [Flavobacteriales bacterium]